jgi:hypothetical protein
MNFNGVSKGIKGPKRLECICFLTNNYNGCSVGFGCKKERLGVNFWLIMKQERLVHRSICLFVVPLLAEWRNK